MFGLYKFVMVKLQMCWYKQHEILREKLKNSSAGYSPEVHTEMTLMG